MKKVPLEDVDPGDVAATDVRIYSHRPNVQYRIRIDQGQALTRRHINRLSRVGVGHLFLRDPALEDLDPFIVDEDLQQAENRLTRELSDIRNDLQTGANLSISVERLQNALEKLTEAITETEALMGFTSLKSHNDYTAKHSVDVAKLSVHLLLANRAKLREKLRNESGASRTYTNKYMLEDLGLGALLHDLGKWKLPQEILEKSSSLDDREWEAVKTHPKAGHELIEDQKRDFRAPVKTPALQHHEQFGGGGYPKGIGGEKIHLYGRIAALADVYSALTSTRPYRVEKTPNRARQIMNRMQEDHEHFDPELFDMFKEAIPPFPVGQQVILSNGSRGVVAEVPDQPDQPTVRILQEGSERLDEPYEITANTEDGPAIVN
jgi:HD-GYP domain-containing protein (c-di-GMP phosphodiesterase class II)